MTSSAPSDRQNGVSPPSPAGNPLVAVSIAIFAAVGFYGCVAAIGYTPLDGVAEPLRRYFAGHPVAIAATVLFCGAIGILLAKYLSILNQRASAAAIADSQLVPSPEDDDSPAAQWRRDNDVKHVAETWLDHLQTLPRPVFDSRLIVRLREVLIRRTDRGSGSSAGDDLRELATRDADAAHDSLGLVRIIVWAIPMLGFLGTVIGITQTLGGLDFSDGQAAVDSLKVGLNVAFDTTALGLVLSVVAIFLQFPVERAEMDMLAAIDARVGRIAAKHLPSDDPIDDQTLLVSELCRGIETAVAQSLADQTKLWRSTIDEAQSHWVGNHQSQHEAFVKAFEVALIPSLQTHADAFRDASGETTHSAAAVTHASEVLQQSTMTLQQNTQTLSDQMQDTLAALRTTADDQNQNVAEAVIVLARAMDHLATRMRQPSDGEANEKSDDRTASNPSGSAKSIPGAGIVGVGASSASKPVDFATGSSDSNDARRAA